MIRYKQEKQPDITFISMSNTHSLASKIHDEYYFVIHSKSYVLSCNKM